jgi:hypothetical protein
MGLLLLLLGVVLAVWGVITLIHGGILLGIVLLVVGIVLAGWGGGTRTGL